MTTKVLKVLEVELLIQEVNPPNLVVKAKGEVTSEGWTNARLVPYVYIAPPVDGIYEFDFVAESPNGMVPQIISPIETEPFIWKSYPNELKRVKVYASANSLTEKL